ncbi:translation elongation factor Ts [Patescibacteria group bacterium]|nr:translation elongation factor Ts [Patescibacteria group bacterium]
MEIKAEIVKKLRDLTGSGMMDVKKALQASDGDFEKAAKLLREKGAQIAASKSARVASQGLIVSYIHPGDKVGVLVELNCETDFVSRNEDFKKLAHNLAVHVAGMHPLYVAPEDVPSDVVKKEKDLYKTQLKGKSKELTEQALEGKLNGFYEAVCLTKQPFVLNQDKKVEDLISEIVGILKENIKIGRFVRFELGVRE